MPGNISDPQDPQTLVDKHTRAWGGTLKSPSYAELIMCSVAGSIFRFRGGTKAVVAARA